MTESSQQPLAPQVAGIAADLRAKARQAAAEAGLRAALHALILSMFARVATRLEELVRLWQAGLLVPPTPRTPRQRPSHAATPPVPPSPTLWDWLSNLLPAPEPDVEPAPRQDSAHAPAGPQGQGRHAPSCHQATRPRCHNSREGQRPGATSVPRPSPRPYAAWRGQRAPMSGPRALIPLRAHAPPWRCLSTTALADAPNHALIVPIS